MERILIYQTAFLGDLLLAIPLIRNTRQLFPTAEIHLACRAPFGSFFSDLNLVDRVHEVDKHQPSSVRAFEAGLFQVRWGLILCAHRSLRTRLLLARLRSKLKIGFEGFGNSLIFDRAVFYRQNYPDPLRQLSLLAPLSDEIHASLNRYHPQARRQRLHQGDALAPLATSHSMRLPLIPIDVLPTHWRWSKPVLFIAPGSQWETKRWTLEGYSRVARSWIDKGYDVVAVGTKGERNLIESLQIPGDRFHNLAGQTSLTELLALFQRGSALVCNDSGLMHLASAAGLPVVAAFGPTVIELGYEPWQDQAQIVEVSLDCRPCGKHGHHSCPIGTHACMKNIPPDHIIKILESKF